MLRLGLGRGRAKGLRVAQAGLRVAQAESRATQAEGTEGRESERANAGISSLRTRWSWA